MFDTSKNVRGGPAPRDCRGTQQCVIENGGDGGSYGGDGEQQSGRRVRSAANRSLRVETVQTELQLSI